MKQEIKKLRKKILFELRYNVPKSSFYFSETKNGTDSDALTLYVQVVGRNNAQALFRLTESDQTNHFISELFRLIEYSSKNKNTSNFKWIEPYLTSHLEGMDLKNRKKEEPGFLEQTVSCFN